MEAITAILSSLFGPYFDLLARTFGYATSSGDFVGSLASEMSELLSKRDDVRREVSKAEREGRDPKSQVKWWLDSVEALESTANEIEEEYQKRWDYSPNLWTCYQLSKRAEEALADAKELKEKGYFWQVADELAPERFVEMPSSTATVGTAMGAALDRLLRYVRDGEIGIIGIHGMGGIGKTELLSRFNNEFLAKDIELGLAISLEVTKDVTVDEIQRALGDRVGLTWHETKTQKERAAILFKVLTRMKFVIILDDLWEPLNLHSVGIPIPKRYSKSKIIITTRMEDVCDRMDAKKISMECLGWEEAWDLFREKAGRERINSHPEIRRHAEALARKCGGLPLALITVGRAMASKRTPGEWQHAVIVLSTTPSQIPGMEEAVLDRLKLSYDCLRDDKLRKCFLYFSLFWDNCRVAKDLLVKYWIGEGIIDRFDSIEDASNKGLYLLGILSAASLIERVDDEGCTNMHPMMRLMGLWVACECGRQEDKWLARESEGLTEAPESENWRGAERISLGYNSISVLPSAPRCPKLVTLMLRSNVALSRIPDNFFRYMPCLRVLDLAYTSITELPSAIGNLVGLQYLDLHKTKITSLPKELGRLIRLRYLELGWTEDLRFIPNGVLASLVELRVLYMYVSYCSWKVGSSGTGESSWKVGSSGLGVSIEELEALKRLKALQITIGSAEALQRLSRNHRLAACTCWLKITCWNGLKTMQLPSATLGRNMKNLGLLQISDSVGLEEVVLGAQDGGDDERHALLNLRDLILQHLHKTKIVWGGNSFQSLHSLYIYNCHKMEQLFHCKDETSTNEEDLGIFTPFPNLREMHLNDLPDLKRLSGDRRTFSFPSLEVLEVQGCQKLKMLALVADKLRELRCHRSWWNELEWEDDITKSDFETLLQPLD